MRSESLGWRSVCAHATHWAAHVSVLLGTHHFSPGDFFIPVASTGPKAFNSGLASFLAFVRSCFLLCSPYPGAEEVLRAAFPQVWI